MDKESPREAIARVAQQVRVMLAQDPAVRARFEVQAGAYVEALADCHDALARRDDDRVRAIDAAQSDPALTNFASRPSAAHSWETYPRGVSLKGGGRRAEYPAAWVVVPPKPTPPQKQDRLRHHYALLAAAHDAVCVSDSQNGSALPIVNVEEREGRYWIGDRRSAIGAAVWTNDAVRWIKEHCQPDVVAGRLEEALAAVKADLRQHPQHASAIQQSGSLGALAHSFDRFHEALLATTVPTSDGGRRVLGVPHAIALSEATDALYHELAATSNSMHDRSLRSRA